MRVTTTATTVNKLVSIGPEGSAPVVVEGQMPPIRAGRDDPTQGAGNPTGEAFVTGNVLAIVSKIDHYVCMTQTPTLDVQELRSVITDAGHTAVGFATMAAKKANDVRLDFSDRYETSIVDFRKQALVIVKRVESVRADVEARVEPVVAKVVDRLPQPAQKLINDATDAAKELQNKSYDFVVKALTVESSAKPVSKTVKPAVKKAAAGATRKVSVAKAAVKPVAKKVVAKKTAVKKAVVKATPRKATPRKAVAKKAVAKKAAA